MMEFTARKIANHDAYASAPPFVTPPRPSRATEAQRPRAPLWVDEPRASEAGDMECEVDDGDVKPDVKPDLAALASAEDNKAGTSSKAIGSCRRQPTPSAASPETQHRPSASRTFRWGTLIVASRPPPVGPVKRHSSRPAGSSDSSGGVNWDPKAPDRASANTGVTTSAPADAGCRVIEDTASGRVRRQHLKAIAERIIAHWVAAGHARPGTTSPVTRPAPPYVRLCWSACLLASKSWGDVGESAVFVIPAVYLLPTSKHPSCIEKATSI